MNCEKTFWDYDRLYLWLFGVIIIAAVSLVSLRFFGLGQWSPVFSLCDLDLSPVLRKNSCFIALLLQIVLAEEQVRAKKEDHVPCHRNMSLAACHPV